MDRKLIIGTRPDERREAIFFDFSGNWHNEKDDTHFTNVLDAALRACEGVAGRYLVFDITAVGVIHGRGIQLMTRYQAHSHQRRGLLILINPSERVREALYMKFHESLSQIFPVVASGDEAKDKIDEHRRGISESVTVRAGEEKK